MRDNLEELKNKWQSLKVNNDRLEAANRRLSSELMNHRVTSLQDRLKKRIGRFRWVGAVLPLFAPFLYFMHGFPVWLTVAYAAFGLMMFVLNTLLYSYIDECQLASMAVIDAVRRATMIKIYQRRIRVVGLLIGIPLLIAIFIMLLGGDDTYVIVGACVGAAFGGAIGLAKAVENATLARRILSSLRDDGAESDVTD